MVKKRICREWGFDLTGFGTASKFKGLLKRHHLTKHKKECEKTPIGTYCTFVWKNKDIKLITGNNPITGKYTREKQRLPEKGYASYIGITGNPKKVEALAKDIKRTAEFIKDESKCEREFI